MTIDETFIGVDVVPVEIPVENEGIMDPEAVEKLSKGFGNGTTERKILVTKGITLKKLHEVSK